MRYADRYNYKELLDNAMAPNATQEDIDRLAEWFEIEGHSYWNGECYDIDGCHALYPVQEYNEEEDIWTTVRWEIR